MQEIDRELIEKAGEGDMKAFHELYQKSSGFVYTLAYRVTNRKHDAEEVTQDVFLRIHRSLRSFQFKSSFKTWIYRIAVNTALNHIQKRGRTETHEIEIDEKRITASVAPSAGDALERVEHEKKLQGLLEQINPDQRACLVLREIEGMDYAEIAQTLGINLNTVRTRLKRAREALMKIAQKEVVSHAL